MDNSALLEAFRHDAWANRELLDFCRDLSPEQLNASASGSYGNIRETFNHIVMGHARYLRRLAGGAPAWVDTPGGGDPGDTGPGGGGPAEAPPPRDEPEPALDPIP